MSAEMHWPDEHVAHQFILSAAPEHAVPFGVHVFIFHTIGQLQEACGDFNSNAHSTTYDEPDGNDVGALVMLSKSDLEVALVAHEATHIALFHHARIPKRRTSARRWLAQHPESMAEMVGNLTALIWHNLPQDL